MYSKNRIQLELIAVYRCHILSPLMRASLSEDRNKTGTGPVENASAEDAMDAVAAAESAMGGWKTVSPRGARGEILRRAYELMIQRKTWQG